MASSGLTPTEVIARRVREVRNRRGWSGQHLAEELARVGITKWDRSTVAKLETGRRENVTVAELLALAYVLDVAPVHLVTPLDDEALYQVTPDYAEYAGTVRDWVRGFVPLADTKARWFFEDVPSRELGSVYVRGSDDLAALHDLIHARQAEAREAADGG